MKNYLLSSLLLMFICVGVNAETYVPSSQDSVLASAVIASGASVEKEVVKLYQAQLKNPKSKISKFLSEYSQLIDAKSEDLVLIDQDASAGQFSARYLLPIRMGRKSSTSVIAYISVNYYVDMESEESNLSNKLYLTSFVDIEIKDIVK